MRPILAALVSATIALSLAGSADAASCRDAKGKYVKCPAPAAAASSSGKSAAATTTSATPAATTSTGAGPNCKKGKRCGNACISVKDTCHK
jgi:hypothetical protein